MLWEEYASRWVSSPSSYPPDSSLQNISSLVEELLFSLLCSEAKARLGVAGCTALLDMLSLHVLRTSASARSQRRATPKGWS